MSFVHLVIITVIQLVNWHQCSFLDTKTCESLLVGQFKCSKPEIDYKTQQPANCTQEGVAQVACYPAPGVYCDNVLHDGKTVGFYKNITCKWTTSYSYKIALLLSIFLGVFGIDRFYLGYVAIGLLKLCTFGFMLFGYVIDLLLILTQTLEPADGSAYIVDYYDQIVHSSSSYGNNTFNFTYF